MSTTGSFATDAPGSCAPPAPCAPVPAEGVPVEVLAHSVPHVDKRTGIDRDLDRGLDRPILVQKYGGSSVATPEKLKHVAMHVAKTAQQGVAVVVVVSAMGKTTDDLLGLARAVSQTPSRRELDMLLTCGERVSMALLAMALSDLGVPAISFTGSQSGILTNDRHSGARIIEVRPVRIQDELFRGRVVIVAGFQGMSYKREITTLGRGGSDTTAVALAAALGAQHCEIYSDVDGVYTADPNAVIEARHLAQLGYGEMQELAAHGAKVLNAQAVEWAQRAGIVIHARRTPPPQSAPESPPRETQICPDSPSQSLETQATAVTSSTEVLELVTTRFGDAALAVLAAQGVQLRAASLQPTGARSSLRAVFVRDDLPDFSRTLEALRQAAPDLSIDDSLGSVTAVGPGLFAQPSTLQQIDRCLRKAGLSPVRYETSPLRITVSLPRAEVQPALRSLHALLCAQRSPR